MNVEELKARLRALLHQRDSLPLSRWIGLRDDALESLHLWWLLFSGHGLKDDKMFWSLRDPIFRPRLQSSVGKYLHCRLTAYQGLIIINLTTREERHKNTLMATWAERQNRLTLLFVFCEGGT